MEKANVKRAFMMAFKFKWFSVLEVSWLLLLLFESSRRLVDYGDTVVRVDLGSYLLGETVSDEIVIANSGSDYVDWVSHPASPAAFYLDYMERNVIRTAMQNTLNCDNCELLATRASASNRVECSLRSFNSSRFLASNNIERVHSGSRGKNCTHPALEMVDYSKSYITLPPDNKLTIIIRCYFSDSNLLLQFKLKVFYGSLDNTWRAFPGSECSTNPAYDPRVRPWFRAGLPIKQLENLEDCVSSMFTVVKPVFGPSESTIYLVQSEFLKALVPEDLVDDFSFSYNGASFLNKQVSRGNEPKRPSSWSNIIITDCPADIRKPNLFAAIHDVMQTFQPIILLLKVTLVFRDGNFEHSRLETNLLADSQVRFKFYMLPDNFDYDPRKLSALKSVLVDSNNHFEVLGRASAMSSCTGNKDIFHFLSSQGLFQLPRSTGGIYLSVFSGDLNRAFPTSSGAHDEHLNSKTYDTCSQLALKVHGPYNPKDLTSYLVSKVHSFSLAKTSMVSSHIHEFSCCGSCSTLVRSSGFCEKNSSTTSVPTIMLWLLVFLIVLMFKEKINVYLFFYKPRTSDSNYVLNVPVVIGNVIRKIKLVSTLIEDHSRKSPRKSSEIHFMYQSATLKIVLIRVKKYLERDAFRFKRIESKYRYLKHNKELEDVCQRFSREMEILLRRAELLLKNCCKCNNKFWIQNVIIHSLSHEDFIDITSSFEWCLNILHHHLTAVSDKSWIGVSPPKWLPVSKIDIDKDLSKLLKRLASFIRNTSGDHFNFELASYLYSWRSMVFNSSDRTTLSEIDEQILMQAPSSQKLEQTLGRGSNGNVYKVRWLGVDCAMKVFKDHAMDHWKKELATLAKHSHPHIVKFFCCSGEPAIIMELMKEDLYTFIASNLRAKKCNLPLEVALEIMLQIAKGMAFLHKHGIAHRDLKSLNIFLNYEGQSEDLSSHFQVVVKVGDFGLASSFDPINPRGFCLQPGEDFGSRFWKAPELFPQNRSGSEIMPKPLDVYGFGVICHEIITGKVPFEDAKRMCIADFADYVQAGQRPALPSTDRCPEGLAELIRDCWQTHSCSRPEFDDICWRLLNLKSSWVLNGNIPDKINGTL